MLGLDGGIWDQVQRADGLLPPGVVALVTLLRPDEKL